MWIQVQCQVPFSGEEAMLRPAALPGLHVQLFRRLQEGRWDDETRRNQETRSSDVQWFCIFNRFWETIATGIDIILLPDSFKLQQNKLGCSMLEPKTCPGETYREAKWQCYDAYCRVWAWLFEKFWQHLFAHLVCLLLVTDWNGTSNMSQCHMTIQKSCSMRSKIWKGNFQTSQNPLLFEPDWSKVCMALGVNQILQGLTYYAIVPCLHWRIW